MVLLTKVFILVVVVAVVTVHALEQEDGVVAVVPITIDLVVLVDLVLGVILEVRYQLPHFQVVDLQQFQSMVEVLVEIHLVLPVLVENKIMVLLL